MQYKIRKIISHLVLSGLLIITGFSIAPALGDNIKLAQNQSGKDDRDERRKRNKEKKAEEKKRNQKERANKREELRRKRRENAQKQNNRRQNFERQRRERNQKAQNNENDRRALRRKEIEKRRNEIKSRRKVEERIRQNIRRQKAEQNNKDQARKRLLQKRQAEEKARRQRIREKRVNQNNNRDRRNFTKDDREFRKRFERLRRERRERRKRLQEKLKNTSKADRRRLRKRREAIRNRLKNIHRAKRDAQVRKEIQERRERRKARERIRARKDIRELRRELRRKKRRRIIGRRGELLTIEIPDYETRRRRYRSYEGRRKYRRGLHIFLTPPLGAFIASELYFLDGSEATTRDLEDALEYPLAVDLDRSYEIEEVIANPEVRRKVRSINLDTIKFAFGSAEVAEDQLETLDNIAEAIANVLRRNPKQIILIEGYTDAVGGEEINQSLSEDRAEAVKDALVTQYGIPAENLIAVGYGKQFLKIDTDEAEEENRRVSIRNISPLIGREYSRRRRR